MSHGELLAELDTMRVDLEVAQGVLERQRREVAFLATTVSGMLERVSQLRDEIAGDRTYVRTLDDRVRRFVEQHTAEAS